MERMSYPLSFCVSKIEGVMTATDSNFKLCESIRIARDAQRLCNLKAIPGKWFCFFLSLSIGLCFAFMCNEQVIWVFISVALFPFITYVHKHKTGLWPFGFAPFIGQVDNFHSNRGLWKKMKVNLVVQLLSILVVLSMFMFFVDILEFRDKGFWWAPIASGTVMWLAMYILLLASSHYFHTKYSVDYNE